MFAAVLAADDCRCSASRGGTGEYYWSSYLLVTKCASSPAQACLTRRWRGTWTLTETRAREHSVFHETRKRVRLRVGACGRCRRMQQRVDQRLRQRRKDDVEANGDRLVVA